MHIGSQKGLDPLELEFRAVANHHRGCCEPNPGPLQKAELSLCFQSCPFNTCQALTLSRWKLSCGFLPHSVHWFESMNNQLRVTSAASASQWGQKSQHCPLVSFNPSQSRFLFSLRPPCLLFSLTACCKSLNLGLCLCLGDSQRTLLCLLLNSTESIPWGRNEGHFTEVSS